MRMRESFSKRRPKSEVLLEIETGLNEYRESVPGEGNDMREYLRSLSMFSEYEDLLKMIEEDPGISEKNTERFRAEKSTLQKLQYLARLPLADSIEYLLYSASDKGSDFLTGRLERYRELIEEGKDVGDVKRGLLRDLMYAAMQGTPEMGALKIANKRLRSEDAESKGVAELFGYYSGIYRRYNARGNESEVEFDLGVYPDLIKLYENAKKQVELSIKKFKLPLPKERVEHEAVLKTAGWLVEMKKVYGRIYYSNEERNYRQHEAFAWAQLGTGIKNRMASMLAKMPDHACNFRNIGRFIGKSGNNKYAAERKRLYGQTRFLTGAETPEAEKQAFVKKENEFAAEKMARWHEKERERLRRKQEKTGGTETVVEAELEQEYDARLTYLQNRGTDELVRDLEERQHLVARRYEKRKSIAEKAFDLHFHFNHPKKEERGRGSTGTEGTSIPAAGSTRSFSDMIDWINNAPFGTIKRAHAMARRGVSDETIIKLSFAEMHGNKERGLTRDALDSSFFLDHLIAANQVNFFFNYRSDFSEITDTQVADKLLASDAISSYIDKCVNLDQSVADKLMASGHGLLIAENLSSFANLDERKIVNALIEKHGSGYYNKYSLFRSLDNFSSIDHADVAKKLIARGIIPTAEEYVRNMHNDHHATAQTLIEAGVVGSFDEYLEKFNCDRNKIADALLRSEQEHCLANNLPYYRKKGLDASVARSLLERGMAERVVREMHIFRGLNHTEVVDALLAAKQYDTLLRNIEKFSDMDCTDVALKLIKAGEGGDVAGNMNMFKRIDHMPIARALLDAGEPRALAEHISYFKDLDVVIAARLVDAGLLHAVLSSPESFNNLDQKGIVDRAIEKGNANMVAQYIVYASELDHREVANKIIQAGGGDAVAYNLANFKGIDHAKMADTLIQAGFGGAVARNLYNFKDLDHNVLAKKLIATGNSNAVSGYLSAFKGLDSVVASALPIGVVAENLGSFRDLDPSFAYEIIKAGKGLYILRSAASFAELNTAHIEQLVRQATKREVADSRSSLFAYLEARSDVAMELLRTGKDDVAHKIGSTGFVIDNGTLSQFPEHVAVAYKIGYNSDLAKLKSTIAIRPERNPITIRSILRGLEGNKLGKNFRESIEYLFDAADTDAKEMIAEIIRTDHASAPRLVRTLVQIDASKGTRYAIDLIRRSGTPDKLFAYFVHFLAKSGGITKNAPEFLKTPGNVPVIRRMVAANPNQLDTTLDTCKALGIANLQSEDETLFGALRDIQSITPKIYRTYRSLNGAQRKEFAEWVNRQKEELFENKKIDFGAAAAVPAAGEYAKDRDIAIEMVQQAYNPIGMSFESVKSLLSRVEDRTNDIGQYAFPAKGYTVSFNDTSYLLRKGETLNKEALSKAAHILQYRDTGSMTLAELETYNKKRDTAFARLARATTDFSEEEISMLFQAVSSQESIQNLYRDISAKKGGYDYPLLARMHEAFGIYAKDNLPACIELYIQAHGELDERITKIFGDPARRVQILKALKAADEEVAGVSDKALVGRLLSEKVLEKQRALIKKEMRKFQREAGGEGEASGEYRVYLSKNKGSFFAKAAAGICTAQDITLWNMTNHFHINIVDDRQIVQGNIQGFFETVNGKPALVLRGFNPTETMLKRVSPESFMKNMIRIAKEFAVANHIDSVYITEHLTGWHADSNRTQIQEFNRKHIYSKVAPVAHRMKIAGSKNVDTIYPL